MSDQKFDLRISFKSLLFRLNLKCYFENQEKKTTKLTSIKSLRSESMFARVKIKVKFLAFLSVVVMYITPSLPKLVYCPGTFLS